MKKSIGRLISILHRQSQIYINNSLKEFNITSAEYSFLLSLYRKEGVTQDELSCYLHIDKSATTRAIRSLEEKGLVTRNKDDIDKRFNRVYLTEKAINFKDKVRERIFHWSEFLAEDLDEETYDMVYNVLEKMVDKVEGTDFKKLMEDKIWNM